MDEEWVIVMVEAVPLGGGEARPMVGICPVSVSDPHSDVAICPDEESAAYEAAAVAEALGLPLYDGADPHPMPLDAARYVDRDWDGTDRYAEAAAIARRDGAPMPQVPSIQAKVHARLETSSPGTVHLNPGGSSRALQRAQNRDGARRQKHPANGRGEDR